MREQIKVVYENGVFRALEALPSRFQEYRQLRFTVQDATSASLADADPTVSLEAVRGALAKNAGHHCTTRTVRA